MRLKKEDIELIKRWRVIVDPDKLCPFRVPILRGYEYCQVCTYVFPELIDIQIKYHCDEIYCPCRFHDEISTVFLNVDKFLLEHKEKYGY